MKHVLYLLSITLLFAFAACSDNDSSLDLAWKSANDKAYQEITENPEYTKLETETGPSGVYYKVLKSGDSAERPLHTSRVKVLYFGEYYDGTVFDSGSRIYNDKNELVEQNPITPKSFSIAETIRGFSFALQNMVVGDQWDIWIPYWLGYGETGYINSSTGQTLIKAYSTLHFVVELVEITQYP